jgi:hypothetical protein
MATLDEIKAYFHEYDVYFVSEYMGDPSAVRDVYVINDNHEIVAYFIEWDNDEDGEPCVYLLEEDTTLNFEDALREYEMYGFTVEADLVLY